MGKSYIITGYYGSGKTEFSVNLAKKLARENKKVTIADLDIINPYFRSRERVDFLSSLNIDVVGGSLNNNTGQDMPAVSYSFLSEINKGNDIIIDLAGSEQGINLLANTYSFIKEYEFLCVLNSFRPETESSSKMIDFIRIINSKSKLNINGLVNNGHMLHYTEDYHIIDSRNKILQASEILNIPLKYTIAKSNIINNIDTSNWKEELIIFDKLEMREDWQ